MIVDIPIAIALGFDEPTRGLMERAPRPVGAPVLSTSNWVRLCAQGFVMTVGSLLAYQIAESNYGEPLVASTMLLTTLSLFHLVAGLLARDQVHTIFDRDAVPGSAQSRRYGLSLLAIVGITAIGFLQRVFSTTSLNFEQWWICIGLASSLVVVEELIKVFVRRRTREPLPRASTGRRPWPPEEVGVSEALVVTSYQSASSGLMNLFIPTSAVVMGGLAIARVPSDDTSGGYGRSWPCSPCSA